MYESIIESNNFLNIQIKFNYKFNYKLGDKIEKISTELNEILQNFEHIIEYETYENKDCFGCIPMPEFIRIYVQNHENNDFFENYLDNLRKEITFRYMIKCYNPVKKYPSSIRINKKGQKIITKQQTKLIGL